MTGPIYKGEAILLNWNENKSGRKIVLQLEKDGPGSHPFDGLDGERFAVVIVGPLASDEHTNLGARKEVDTRANPSGDELTTPAPSSKAHSVSGCAGSIPAEVSGAGNGTPPKPHKPTKWADMKPAARAALLCKDPEFWGYLDAMAMDGRLAFLDEPSATAELKTRCGVESRAEIVEGSRAAAELSRIIGNFNAYKQAKGLGQI